MHTEKSGVKNYFGNCDGNSANSLESDETEGLISGWLISKSMDVFGNYSKYNYFKHLGVSYIQSITYTHNDSNPIPKFRKVEFEYNTRGSCYWCTDIDSPIIYKNGYFQQLGMILGEISTYTNVTNSSQIRDLVTNYILNYEQSNNSGRYKLISVTQKASNYSSTQPPYSIEYYNPNADWHDGDFADSIYTTNFATFKTARVNEYPALGSVSLPLDIVGGAGEDLGVRFVDLNGDGFMDIIKSFCPAVGPSEREVWINKKDGSWQEEATNSPYQLPDGICFTNQDGDNGMRMADLNGDGTVDIIIARELLYGGIIRGVYLFITGFGWEERDGNEPYSLDNPESDAINLFFVDASGQDTGFRLFDVNHDGKADIVKRDTIILNNNGSWELTELPVNANHDFAFTGDGEPENANSWRDHGADMGQDTGMRLVDINQDGCIDILQSLLKNGNSYKEICISTCFMGIYECHSDYDTDSPFDITNIPFFTEINGSLVLDTGTRIADLNGDGGIDIISATEIYYNENSQFVERGDTFFTYKPFVDGSYNESTGRLFVDLNGDGLADLVRAKENHSHEIFLNSIAYDGLLKSVTSPLGGKVEIAYANSNTPTSNHRFLPINRLVVSSVTLSDNKGNNMTTNYTYEDGKYDMDRKEFVGFGKVTTVDSLGRTGKTYFHQDNLYRGLPYKEYKYSSSGDVAQYKEITYACKKFNTPQNCQDIENEVKDVRATAETIQSYSQETSNIITTGVANIYDYCGNRTISLNYNDTTINTDNQKLMSSYIYGAGVNKCISNRLSESKSFDYKNNLTSWKRSFYDNKPYGQKTIGLPTSSRIYRWNLNSSTSSGTWIISGSTQYDVYGNVKKEYNSNGALARVITYDPYYFTYPIRETNGIGQVKEYQNYDFRFGKPYSGPQFSNQ